MGNVMGGEKYEQRLKSRAYSGIIKCQTNSNDPRIPILALLRLLSELTQKYMVHVFIFPPRANGPQICPT